MMIHFWTGVVVGFCCTAGVILALVLWRKP